MVKFVSLTFSLLIFILVSSLLIHNNNNNNFVSAGEIRLNLYLTSNNCSGPARSAASYIDGKCYNSSQSTSTQYSCIDNFKTIQLKTFTASSVCQSTAANPAETINFTSKLCRAEGSSRSIMWVCSSAGSAGSVSYCAIVVVVVVVLVLVLFGAM